MTEDQHHAGSAMSALEPHLNRLRRDIEGRRAKGDRPPIAIMVPITYPRECTKLSFWSLPVISGDVRQPELTCIPMAIPRRAPDTQPAEMTGGPDTSQALRIVDVFVGSGRTTYHADPRCAHLHPEVGVGHDSLYVARCDHAHRSSLLPCSVCSVELAEKMTRVLLPVSPEEKKRRTVPALRRAQSPPRATQETPSTDYAVEDESAPAPESFYGVPGDLSDPRFTVRTASDWGTAFFGSDLEETLSEPTEDDHDWRGASRFID